MGFTLVELLVVMAIIAMLAAATFGALQRSRQTACVRHTEGTIAKIHEMIMRKYESYRTRRVALMDADKSDSGKSNVDPTKTYVPLDTSVLPRNIVALARLNAIRDLVRMEMPERWADIVDPPLTFPYKFQQGNSTVTIHVTIPPPSVYKMYRARCLTDPGPTGKLKADSKGEPGFGPAECLYLTLMTGNAEGREMFKQDEIGDVDGDGFPELIDAWGKPIMWLRWAPGFSSTYAGTNPDGIACSGLSDIQSGDAVMDHDPFDPRNVDVVPDPNPSLPHPRYYVRGFHLIPLIYSSAGHTRYDTTLKMVIPDYGVDPGKNVGFTLNGAGDPYYSAQNGFVGALLQGYALPIHNHHMTQE